ncbi:NAD(+) diphosphatase [Arenimonas sp.]|uniref:NAD(+) diphosphatase n=1 Tax=Arenimonas sp. TaxID=1872635 RepID=UPI0039E37CDF
MTEKRYAFQHRGLDRADHLRTDDAALDRLWTGAQVLVLDVEGQARFVGEDEAPRFPRGGELLAERTGASCFLGLDEQGEPWFALSSEALQALPQKTMELRSAATAWPVFEASVFAQARGLMHWRHRNRFCGACGEATVFARGGHCGRCERCGVEHYPRTDPAIIVAVSDGERLLLGRQASWPEGRWSVLAGFLEPGESLEQAVAREVMEEAGVKIRHARYAASQPWPFPSSLMVGFHAEADPQEPQVGDELEAARWFSAEELRSRVADRSLQISPRLSISRWLIDDWLAAR